MSRMSESAPPALCAAVQHYMIIKWLCFANTFHNHQPHTQQVSPSCACIDVLHNWALYLLSVHIGHQACVSSQTKQWLVKYDLHHISPSTDDVWSAYSPVLALVFCTSERCTGTWAHMLSFQCTSVTTPVSSDSAVIDDPVCAAYSSSTDDVFWPYCLSHHYTQQVSLHQAPCRSWLHDSVWVMSTRVMSLCWWTCIWFVWFLGRTESEPSLGMFMSEGGRGWCTPSTDHEADCNWQNLFLLTEQASNQAAKA